MSGEMGEIQKAAAAYTSGWAPPVWDAERVALLRKAIAPPSATQLEVEFFISWCKRTGLDPFTKQAYFVPRRAKGPDGKWTERHEPMAAESGMAARADVESDFLGISGGAVFAGDVFEMDVAAGTVKHSWSPEARAKAGNRCLGAWARARRRDRDVPIVWLTMDQRIQTRFDTEKQKQVPTTFWEKDGPGMISKCARALAYRLAYPNLFSGVFIREEEQAEAGDQAAQPASSAEPARMTATSRLLQRLAPTASVAAIPTVAKQPAAEPSIEQPDAAPPPVPDAPPASSPSGPTTIAAVIEWGKHKGKAIAEATVVELESAIDEGAEQLGRAKGNEAWIPRVTQAISDLKAELESRQWPDEPGSEG